MEDWAIRLEVSGFERRPDTANLKAVKLLFEAFGICRRHMKEHGPDVAIAFGGYASVPGAMAARSLGVSLVLHEQNVVPGLANRMLAPMAKKIAISFPDTLERCPRWSGKAVVTGNPLWKPVMEGMEEDPWRHFGLERGRKTLAVIGGSQGAASLNRAVAQLLPPWRERGDLQVIHSVGRDKFLEYESELAGTETDKLLYRPMGFIKRMDLLYEVSDLVVCRAGASTVSELAAAGCASILVPYPYATASHQDANAAVLARAGAAVVIDDRELEGERLHHEIDRLLDDPGRLCKMRESSRGVARKDASAALAEIVLSCV